MSAMVANGEVCRGSLPWRDTVTLAKPLRIGLLNNMPDGATMRTEQHFRDLLVEAADGVPVEVICHALPTISRSEKARQHIEASYEPIETLWDHSPDAVVVTGTEPRERDLRDEPYWPSLARLIDKIDEHAVPAMFSCLAAHAAVLRTDGIVRTSLDEKCFGVFEHEVATDQPLMNGTGPRMWLPHTRWNQVSEAQLVKAKYQILSRSERAGVGFFSRQGRSLWLFCQGHPEYDAPNLLREYRRDVSRFLSKQRATYPELPRDYFTEEEGRILRSFRQQALARGDASMMSAFPSVGQSSSTKRDVWRPAATRVFRNWLEYVAAARGSAVDGLSAEGGIKGNVLARANEAALSLRISD